MAGVTQDATDRIKAGMSFKHFAGQLGGKGGGRPDMAQGGGSDVAALPRCWHRCLSGSAVSWVDRVSAMLLAQQNFCTFPVLFRGSASVITTRCGHLNARDCPSQRACTADNSRPRR
ncbi:MAG: hypothetical protein CM15mP74_36720 [Halieaceae bacterium]|nr:MAG: hypothetical protein CM15mP74_36720 [Halieaceae bacterium]